MNVDLVDWGERRGGEEGGDNACIGGSNIMMGLLSINMTRVLLLSTLFSSVVVFESCVDISLL